MSATIKPSHLDPTRSATTALSSRIWWLGLLAAACWSAAAALTLYWPDSDDLDSTDLLAFVMLGIAAVLAAATVVRLASGRQIPLLQRLGPWLVALAVFFFVW